MTLQQRELEAPRLKWKTADDWNHASRNPAYFPRAKHSSVTVDPFAAGTLSGKLTSIFGSYSPITPMKNMHKNLLSPPLFMAYKQYNLHGGPNNGAVKLTEEKLKAHERAFSNGQTQRSVSLECAVEKTPAWKIIRASSWRCRWRGLEFLFFRPVWRFDYHLKSLSGWLSTPGVLLLIKISTQKDSQVQDQRIMTDSNSYGSMCEHAERKLTG